MTLSIVIPTLNEAAVVGDLIRNVRAQDSEAEVIVVDGGSSDDTVALAAAAGATVISAPPGRGAQLRAGAAVAGGDALLFLHADTVPDAGALAILHRTLADPSIRGGNFRVRFDGPSRFARWLTGFYAWFRGYGFYYGDSAMFVRRETYDALNGFRPIPVMEDFDFNRRLERLGGTVCIDVVAVTTSSRRFEGRNPVAVLWCWVAIHLLYVFGVPPARLSRLYGLGRSRTVRCR